VPIPQQFFPKAAKFSPGKKLRSFGTIFNKDRLASTRRFKRGRQGIRDAHASAFLVVPDPGLRFVVVEAASARTWVSVASSMGVRCQGMALRRSRGASKSQDHAVSPFHQFSGQALWNARKQDQPIWRSRSRTMFQNHLRLRKEAKLHLVSDVVASLLGAYCYC
jgi:hypothetical protein